MFEAQYIAMELLYALQRLDGRLFFTIFRQGERRFVREAAQAISRSADGYLYLFTPLLLLLLGAGSIWQFVLATACALTAERLFYWSLKNSLRRQRPQEAMPGFRSLVTAADRFSFPSGHTSAAFLLATTLAMTYPGVSAAMYGWATMVGMSRVILGVHYPGDTVAGAFMGTLTGWFCVSYMAGSL